MTNKHHTTILLYIRYNDYTQSVNELELSLDFMLQQTALVIHTNISESLQYIIPVKKLYLSITIEKLLM